MESLLMLVTSLVAAYGNYVVIPDWNGSRSETFCSHLGNAFTYKIVTAQLYNDCMHSIEYGNTTLSDSNK